MKAVGMMLLLWLGGLVSIALIIAAAAASFFIVVPLLLGVGAYLTYRVNKEITNESR